MSDRWNLHGPPLPLIPDESEKVWKSNRFLWAFLGPSGCC